MAKKPLNEQVEDLRKQIEQLRARLAETGAAFVPETEALANIENMVNRAADEAEAKLTVHHAAQVEFAHSNQLGFENLTAFEMQALLNPAALKDHLAREIRDRYLSGDVLTVPESKRGELAKQINATILNLERQEEALIEEAETAGLTIHRRPDADPMAILGLQPSDLPLPAAWFSEKYETIQETADSAQAASVRGRENWHAARLDSQAEETRLERAINAIEHEIGRYRQGNLFIPAELTQDLERSRAKLARISKKRQHAQAEFQKASDHFAAVSAVATRCRDFVEQNGAGAGRVH